MIYYMYEIRNNTNGKIYVGVHSARDVNNTYMGSGKVIKQAIKKHGIENFTKTILEIFSSKEEMYAREKEIVNDEFLLREDVYNLRLGGQGGFDYINSSGIHKFKNKQHTTETKEKIAKSRTGKIHSAESKAKMSKNHFAKTDPEKQKDHARKAAFAMLSKRISSTLNDEVKKKISETLLGQKQEIVICPKCLKSGGVRAMKRYHFNNCRG